MKTKGLSHSRTTQFPSNLCEKASSRFIHSRKYQRNFTSILEKPLKTNESLSIHPDLTTDLPFNLLKISYNTSCDSILDAPGLTTDFSSNILAWGPKDALAMGLCDQIYIYYAETGKINSLLDDPGHCISSVTWNKIDSGVIFSNSLGKIRVFDTNRVKEILTINIPVSRCSSISAENNLVTCGLENGSIVHTDIRAPKSRFVKKRAHKASISGQEWSKSGNLATIGLDQTVKIWELRMLDPIFGVNIGHPGKALSWHPNKKDILACGGDSLMLINAAEGVVETKKDVFETIGGLCWNQDGNSLVSAQGKFLKVHDFALNQMCSFEAHSEPIYFMSKSESEDLTTAGLDETLRFWNLIK